MLTDWLLTAGHLPSSYNRVTALVCALRKAPFDIVLSDLSSDSIAASLLFKELHDQRGPRFALVFLSSLTSESLIAKVLRRGADGYITRPFGKRELLARLEAIARRNRSRMRQTRFIECAGLRVDCSGREVRRDGRTVPLSAKDFDLSQLFLDNVGRLLSRAQIQRVVWGSSVPLASRTLDTHVCRVRRLLGLTPQYGWRLSAIYGWGYRLDRATDDCSVRASLKVASAATSFQQDTAQPDPQHG